MSKIPVYFDCDTGVDDSLALAYLLASPEIELVGVGAVSGNVDAAQAAQNTLDLISLAGRDDIPVAIGAHDPLAGVFDGGVPHIHGRNGVGDVTLPRASRRPEAEDASQLLLRLARQYDGALAIVGVGPTTNIAKALQLDPTLATRISKVTLMGGAALTPGNLSPVAEANIGNDPEAAAIVVGADWDLTLTPLDVTLENTLEEADRQALLNGPSAIVRALGAILDLYFDFHIGVFGRRCSALHDPLAAAIAVGQVRPVLAPATSIVVDATQGPGRGQTICDLRGLRRGAPDLPGARTRIVLSTDRPLGPHLLERLLSLGPPTPAAA